MALADKYLHFLEGFKKQARRKSEPDFVSVLLPEEVSNARTGNKFVDRRKVKVDPITASRDYPSTKPWGDVST